MKKIIVSIVALLLPHFLFCQKMKLSDFYFVRNAEFGYSYIIPTATGKGPVIEKNDKSVLEVSIYTSNDSSYQIAIFSEHYFEMQDKEKEFTGYFESMISGKHEELSGAVILEKEMKLKENCFYVSGKKSGKNFMLKTAISEVPVSGEMVCNTMIFYYSKSKDKTLGKELLNNFGLLR